MSKYNIWTHEQTIENSKIYLNNNDSDDDGDDDDNDDNDDNDVS
jgi:hypothetical protein